MKKTNIIRYEENRNGFIGSLFKPTYLDSAASVKKSSYEGWNFDTVWMINRGINNGRPVPRWILPYVGISATYANMSAGTYAQEFRVELGSDVENAQIYYTTDGTKPTAKSKLYRGGIKLTKNTALKAVTVKDGCLCIRMENQKEGWNGKAMDLDVCGACRMDIGARLHGAFRRQQKRKLCSGEAACQPGV